MKISFASDLHYDVNRLDYQSLLQNQIDFLNKQGVDFYFVAGDSFNDFKKSIEFYEEFNRLSKKTKAYFIAGNHDMVRGVDFDQLESDISKYYLHKKSMKLEGTNYTIVGNNGWYDYSFAKTQLNLSDEQYLAFKRRFWIDGVIESPISDIQRYKLSLRQIRESFEQIKKENPNEKIILVTHFLPKLDFVKFTDNEKWNISTAMLGGEGLGEVIDEFKVEYVNFGHLHIRFPDWKINETTYIHQPLGYNTKNRKEWVSNDFMTEWKKTLKIIDI